MRKTAGALNRGWLAVLGILLILVASAAGLLGLGQLAMTGATLGLALPAPDATVGSGLSAAAASSPITPAVMLLLAVALVVLGLLWLVAQVPRRHAARALRLHDDPSGGMTTCGPDVIARAVEEQVEALPGVTAATALLRGSAAEPELTVRVTANDRSDLLALFHELHGRVARDLADVLEAPLNRFAVELNISTERHGSRSVTLGDTAAPGRRQPA